MKNLILIPLIIVLLIGCSPSISLWADPDPPSTETHFTPPSWIQGLWIDDYTEVEGFVFTKNDFRMFYEQISFLIGISINYFINSNSPYEVFDISEEKLSTNYNIKIVSTTVCTWNFKIMKEGENSMSCHYEYLPKSETEDVIILDYTLLTGY